MRDRLSVAAKRAAAIAVFSTTIAVLAPICFYYYMTSPLAPTLDD